jgi:acetamidase/formamidase
LLLLSRSYTDRSIPPVARIKSGEEITFECLDASNGQIDKHSTIEHIKALVFAEIDQVNGPVYVDGAEPGDVLQVDVLEVETADWGWTAILPGFGLLTDEFLEPHVKIWNLNKEEGYAWFDEDKKIKIPLRPFAGEMGVARGEKGAFSTIPPYNTGV